MEDGEGNEVEAFRQTLAEESGFDLPRVASCGHCEQTFSGESPALACPGKCGVLLCSLDCLYAHLNTSQLCGANDLEGCFVEFVLYHRSMLSLDVAICGGQVRRLPHEWGSKSLSKWLHQRLIHCEFWNLFGLPWNSGWYEFAAKRLEFQLLQLGGCVLLVPDACKCWELCLIRYLLMLPGVTTFWRYTFNSKAWVVHSLGSDLCEPDETYIIADAETGELPAVVKRHLAASLFTRMKKMKLKEPRSDRARWRCGWPAN